MDGLVEEVSVAVVDEVVPVAVPAVGGLADDEGADHAEERGEHGELRVRVRDAAEDGEQHGEERGVVVRGGHPRGVLVVGGDDEAEDQEDGGADQHGALVLARCAQRADAALPEGRLQHALQQRRAEDVEAEAEVGAVDVGALAGGPVDAGVGQAPALLDDEDVGDPDDEAGDRADQGLDVAPPQDVSDPKALIQ